MHISIAAYDANENTGGVNSWVMRMLREWQSRDMEVSCILYSTCRKRQIGTLEQFLLDNHIPYRRTKYQQYMETAVHWTVSAVNKFAADVFITNCLVPAWYAAPQLESAGVPCIGVNHSDDPFCHALADLFISKQARFPLSGYVVVSKYLEELTRSNIAPRTRLHRIPCGITPPSLAATHATQARDREKLRIVYVGRFVEEQKQITRVAKSICSAARKHGCVEGYFVGAGDGEKSIRQVISSYGCESRVQIVGWLPAEEVLPRIAGMDVATLMSDYEGFPLALLESMSVGLIPICAKMKSGVGELISSGTNGYLVEPNEASFVDAIDQLVGSPQLRAQMSDLAARTVRDKHTNSICADSWCDVIQDTIARFTPPEIRDRRWAGILPDVHPDLAWADHRQPPWNDRLHDRGRRLLRSIGKRLGGHVRGGTASTDQGGDAADNPVQQHKAA